MTLELTGLQDTTVRKDIFARYPSGQPRVLRLGQAGSELSIWSQPGHKDKERCAKPQTWALLFDHSEYDAARSKLSPAVTREV